jgi:ABC-type nickel/cobalt efflux system permease component RcnA
MRHPLRWLVVLHPVLTLAAIVLTANHWWLDAAVAAMIVFAVAWVDARLLPEHGIRADQPTPGDATLDRERDMEAELVDVC